MRTRETDSCNYLILFVISGTREAVSIGTSQLCRLTFSILKLIGACNPFDYCRFSHIFPPAHVYCAASSLLRTLLALSYRTATERRQLDLPWLLHLWCLALLSLITARSRPWQTSRGISMRLMALSFPLQLTARPHYLLQTVPLCFLALPW